MLTVAAAILQRDPMTAARWLHTMVLPANLLQAQRDYFGAHTFERPDKPGAFHVDWIRLRKQPKN